MTKLTQNQRLALETIESDEEHPQWLRNFVTVALTGGFTHAEILKIIYYSRIKDNEGELWITPGQLALYLRQEDERTQEKEPRQEVEEISINEELELEVIKKTVSTYVPKKHQFAGLITCPARLSNYEVEHSYQDQARWCNIRCASLYISETDEEIEAYCKPYFHIFAKKDQTKKDTVLPEGKKIIQLIKRILKEFEQLPDIEDVKKLKDQWENKLKLLENDPKKEFITLMEKTFSFCQKLSKGMGKTVNPEVLNRNLIAGEEIECMLKQLTQLEEKI